MVNDVRLPLTEPQQQTLDYIISTMNSKKYPPTIHEIQISLGFNNPGYVFKILHYLEKKGYISKIKREHRGIRMTELGEKINNESNGL